MCTHMWHRPLWWVLAVKRSHKKKSQELKRSSGQRAGGPPGLQNLMSLPPALCSFGAALVSVLTDMGSAKIPEEYPGEDLRHRVGVCYISGQFRKDHPQRGTILLLRH